VKPFIVPRAELVFRVSRASGPGGQHVNKTSTRVEVLWDLIRSPSLDDARRERLRHTLRTRLDASGILRVAASARRSQRQNRLAAVRRLQQLVDEALYEPPPRRRTRPPPHAKEARLEAKRRRGQTKSRRSRVREDE
jgi:ribosome-associated protein